MKDFYAIGNSIIAGDYFEVRKCLHKATNCYRSVKILKKSAMEEDDKIMLFNEINNLKDLDHPNILKMYEFFQDPKRYYIVTDTVKGVELFDEIKKRGRFKEADAAQIMRQLLSSISYCHKMNIVHRDLKPENILLEGPNKDIVKVIDFSTSQDLKKNELFHEMIGSPYYVAPEILSCKGCQKSDVWSCGVICYIIICGMPPFNGENELEILKRIKTGKLAFTNPAFDLVSQQCIDFIRTVLNKDPEKRPSATRALDHPWMRKAYKVSLETNLGGDNAMTALNNL